MPDFPAPTLRPSIAHRLLIGAGRLLLLIYFALALLFLAGRHLILPEIDRYRTEIELALTREIGLTVEISDLAAEWPGLHPRLLIGGLRIHDRAGVATLAFDRVEAELSWASLWHASLRLRRLEIIAPNLDVHRDAAGILHVAGLPMHGNDDGGAGFATWLLEQERIVIRDARVVWRDELRSAPPLELQQLSIDLRNSGRHHGFGLVARPSGEIAHHLDLRGNWEGEQIDHLADWHGQLYADLDQANLAAWTPWVDLPLEWRRGRGALRVWLGFRDRLPGRFTADLQLDDVALRLSPDLPELTLDFLHGRLAGERTDTGYTAGIRGLELVTTTGIRMEPTDARLRIDTRQTEAGGEFGVNRLDLGILAALASHLPLPRDVHTRLKAFAPRGQLADLALSWHGPPDAPSRWRAKTTFHDLALAAYRELPGFSGISGKLEGNEQAGQVRFDSQKVKIELPAVFPEPVLELAHLSAETGWKSAEGHTDLLLTRIAFENHDASGEVSGHYRYTGLDMGEIDLSAKISRGVGNAVWRYLPLVVNKDARDWLRAGIIGGRAEGTTLRLSGPLAKFPFRDGKSGIFQVKGRFQGAKLHFATGWPDMSDIDGDLLFEGVRMVIRGQRATLMGAALSEVRAEIPDLEAPEETLIVTGRARGPTQRFLDFIEASPVGERIDHFTTAMRASGNGDLDLKLVLPLRRLQDSEVQGRFRFADNRLEVMPGLPALSAVQGELGFTADRMQAKNVRGRLFDLPVQADVSSLPGGGVRIGASGSLVPAELRRDLSLPLLDHLSGTTRWRSTITVKKPAAEILLESELDGLSSSLPEPFNKSARTSLPLKITGRIGPRDEWGITLGNEVAARLQLAQKQWHGRIAIGSDAARTVAQPGSPAASSPGIALTIARPMIDLDDWIDLFPSSNGGKSTSTDLPLRAIDLKTPHLRLLHRDFHDIRLDGTRDGARWRIALDSREAKGQTFWEGSGAGRITGRFSHLNLPAADTPAVLTETDRPDPTRELPAVDLVIDNFRLREMALGEVRINAENRDGAWQARLDVRNEAATLHGEGRWRPGSIAPETRLTFKLDTEDTEKLLDRLGMPDALRGSRAHLDGQLSWAGTPFAIDYPSLSGQVKLDTGKGQFKKLEPGVGRLLGVLSLQSLPRRITLDFRDIFSEGFAFDTIRGTAKIERGIMRTDALNIRGPAAKIELSGQANLAAETQDLRVQVQPVIGESLAVGAMLAHPVAGAVAWVAQKVLDDPLDKAFAYEYVISGGWSDPKVEKLSQPAAAERKSRP